MPQIHLAPATPGVHARGIRLGVVYEAGCRNRIAGDVAMGDTIVVRARDNYVALASGTRVGRYVVRSVLGQGSFGITYLAHDGQLGCDVAIKEYLPTALAVRHDGVIVVPNSTKVAAEFAWGRKRFVDEGHTLAGFRGRPGMVHVYDLVEDNGTAYIVMELVHGAALRQETRPVRPAFRTRRGPPAASFAGRAGHGAPGGIRASRYQAREHPAGPGGMPRPDRFRRRAGCHGRAHQRR